MGRRPDGAGSRARASSCGCRPRSADFFRQRVRIEMGKVQLAARVPGARPPRRAAARATRGAGGPRTRRRRAPRDLSRAARDGARRRLAALPPRDGPRTSGGRPAPPSAGTPCEGPVPGDAASGASVAGGPGPRLPPPPPARPRGTTSRAARSSAARRRPRCGRAVEALGVRVEVVALGTAGAAPALARALLGDPRPLQVLLYLRAGARRARRGAAARADASTWCTPSSCARRRICPRPTTACRWWST